MDDPRNTDNAWVMTRAVHIHDFRQELSSFPLMDLTNRMLGLLVPAGLNIFSMSEGNKIVIFKRA